MSSFGRVPATRPQKRRAGRGPSEKGTPPMASIFRPTYTDKKTGKKRKLKRWYVKYRDADGIVRRVRGYTDKEATKQLAARLERNAARGKEGMVDPFEAHHKRPLAEHVEDYRRYLAAEGNTADYVAQTCSRVLAVNEG